MYLSGVIKSINNDLNGKYWADIMLNLNTMLSNILATLRLKS